MNDFNLRQILYFLSIGAFAACMHFFTVIICVQYLFLQPLIANIFGFVFGFQISYWGHRSYTFVAHEVAHRKALPRLLLVQLIAFMFNEGGFYYLLALHFPYQIALLIVLVIFPFFTFTMSKLWVFKKD